MRAAEAQIEDEKIANEMLNGQMPEDTVESRREALNLVQEQTLCSDEMRLVARRNKHNPHQTKAARNHPRSTDIIVPLPSGTAGLTGLLSLHSDLVKAGCRVTDHWCALGHCIFRSCFCSPISAEQGKRPLVAAESTLKKDDNKLSVDATLVKESEIAAQDKGKDKAATKLEKTEKKVQNKLKKNKAAEVKLQKAEASIDQKAQGEDISSACPPGYRIIPSSAQSFCKKSVFQGVLSFGSIHQ